MITKNFCPSCYTGTLETFCPHCGWEFRKAKNTVKKHAPEVNNELVVTKGGLLCSGTRESKYTVVFGVADDPTDKGRLPYCFTNFLGNVCPGDYKLNY